MKQAGFALCVLMIGWGFSTAPPCRGQGPLTPAGPPQAMMKSLDQVEPRIPISSLPYTITNSGSYYLTGSLQSLDDGIVIATNDVSIDLMGFTVSGNRGYGHYGIKVDNSATNPAQHIAVRNGTVHSFWAGMIVNNAHACRIEQMTVSSNDTYGVRLYGRDGVCNQLSMNHCIVEFNGTVGIILDAENGQANGNLIAYCTSSRNDHEGLYIKTLNSGQAIGNVVRDSQFSRNGQQGILASGTGGACDGNRFERCTVTGNGRQDEFQGEGIYVGSSTGGRANGNVIRDCVVKENGDKGIYLSGNGGECRGNLVVGNTVAGNDGYGIHVFHAGGNRIDSNHVVDQVGAGSTYGIRTDGTENVVIRNSCAGNTFNLSTVSGNLYGPYIQDTGSLGTAAGGSNPWANFDFDD